MFGMGIAEMRTGEPAGNWYRAGGLDIVSKRVIILLRSDKKVKRIFFKKDRENKEWGQTHRMLVNLLSWDTFRKIACCGEFLLLRSR